MLIELLNEGLTVVQTVATASPSGAPAGGPPVETFQHETAWPSESVFESLIPILAIVLSCIIGIVWILASIVTNGQREKTRREIAAYVAEGSISPDDAERMIRAASTSANS